MAKKKKSAYSAKTEARLFIPKVIEALKAEINKGKGGIALIKASELLVKIADIEGMQEAEACTEIKFVEIKADESGSIVAPLPPIDPPPTIDSDPKDSVCP